ncbi:unnamed protein product [Paramecium primaurelia]|uniref:DNA-directed DNA polymerase family A palm domain-containing protein n=1 Tax=Paramecium primaurelia TaxID=5886 RepID=A0A8S1MGA4_PARPR|nr:unnamed protein product [Paramecium primaurelia]
MIKFRFCKFAQINSITSLKSRIGGSSKTPEYDLYRSYYNKTIEDIKEQPGVTIVKNINDAKRVIDILNKYKKQPHAWDTETIDIDVKSETPINRGKLICASAFAGPEVNFGNGPRLFIDNFAQNSDLIMLFKEYFEDEKILKIWHNYGFDKHIFGNHGINVKGFFGDTMHMARLLDPSKQPQEYSLAKLSLAYEDEIKLVKIKRMECLLKKPNLTDEERSSLQLFKDHLLDINLKTSMKQIFGQNKELKNGQVSKLKVYPKILQMHCLPQYINQWIEYSTLDSEITYFLCLTLKDLLNKTKIFYNLKPTDPDFQTKKSEFGINCLGDIYSKYWNSLGEILTELEREGMQVDMDHVKNIKLQAEEDMKQYEQNFIKWVQTTQEGDVSQFNCSSTQQLQQLFFAPCKKQQTKKTPQMMKEEEEEDEYLSDGRKKSIRKEVEDLPEVKSFQIDNIHQIIKENQRTPLKYTEMHIKGLGIEPLSYTPSGMPQADYNALKQLAGDVEKQQYGLIYHHFVGKGEPQKGIDACLAINDLLELKSIEVLLHTFIIPLIELTDPSGRIHTSININTETGRLSSRNPNLLNQPALEKDRYKIRKSFIAKKGNKLIVADYGQLELRVLAHMTKCKAMIDAFLKGGDFHSRTVITMFPHIQEEIDKGELLIEWDKQKGKAPAPLVKDKYAAERRKAKVLNFSIAYGKTATGFAKDWQCEVKEAQKTIDAWFAQRKEVEQWQYNVRMIAKNQFFTQTLLGRYRYLEKYFQQQTRSYINHGLRAAINTPIQGGAADIVIAAMVKIYKNQSLKDLGYKLLLQVHDELILEGPEENAQQALKIVKELMENPFEIQLELPLEVDAKIGNNWYECK